MDHTQQCGALPIVNLSSERLQDKENRKISIKNR